VRRWLLFLALTAALAGAAQRPAPAQTSPAPLTNEDVVRMVNQGRPEAEILRIIAASPAQFDLDREMAEELRRAGVSEKILTAMRQRQAETGVRQGVEAPLPPIPVPRGTLDMTFAPLEGSDKRQEATFEMVREIPLWAIQRLGMEEKAKVEELALFIACTTPEHVPDHWQDRTPVKDFTRHELFLFHPGSRPGKTKKFDVLSLDLPAPLAVEAPAGIHRLAVGVAAKIGADWRVVASDARQGVEVLEGKTTGVRVKLKGLLTGSGMKGFKEEQGLIIDSVQEPEKTP
jgi:hypothetical protein